MARLKELLFDGDAETLKEINRRLAELERGGIDQARHHGAAVERLEKLSERIGTEERFRTSVANVIDKALEDAEMRNHAQMSRAIAPLVINTIKTELRNSQDELVDIMFPITGRMVKTYLAAEMKKLSEGVNRKIDENPVMLRIRSLTSGRPVSDLAIAGSQRLSIDEVYLIRRDTGELVAHWPEGASQSNLQSHVGGVLAAINDFASSAFSDEGGHFESFRYDDFQVFMRSSPLYLLAAKCNGIAPSGIEQIFDDAFLETMERIALVEKAAAESGELPPSKRSLELQPLTETVETRTGEIYESIEKSSIGGAIVKFLLFIIAVPLLAWFFWGIYTDAEEALVRGSAQHAITSTDGLEGFRTDINVGYRGRSVTVTGLRPDAETKSMLLNALATELPNTDVKTRIAVVPARVEVVREVLQPAPKVDIEGVERRLYGRLTTLEGQWIKSD